MSENSRPLEVTSDTDLPKSVYHYTDIVGLHGIWESGQLWATGSRFLNDTSELKLGVLVVRGTVARRQAELAQENLDNLKRALEEGEPPMVSDIIDASKSANRAEIAELDEISLATKEAERYMHCHIACLSEKRDQLSQWRGYAREGYCIGFNTQMLLESLGENRVMRRVHYPADGDERINVDENENRYEAYANEVVNYAKSLRQRLLPFVADCDDELRRWMLSKDLTVHAAFLKDGSFREECEVRIVEVNGKPDTFTPHRYGMVPQIFIPIPDGCIESITIGPTAHKELKLLSLFDYTRAVRFKKRDGMAPDSEIAPDIWNSTIPFRDW
ncbi:DUF2971 domain-containing protein [Mycobacteroides chelonae]|uniref:DUF2971 domain-containing protein n=1 Tax=Mycobacteroides chelonae TaxID=1774 RepID=UPI0007DAC9D4|nr:DUF2971 domain-containing protein [Mycobacteroides chelonae]